MLAEVIGWEWGYPELSAKHFLTVATYNLQHPAQFANDAIEGLRAAFIQHLDHGLPVELIRLMAARQYAGNRRVKKPEADRRPTLRRWSTTIADIYREGRPGAADRVVAWAQSVRREISTPD